jgi:hypothetical protein
LYEIGAEHADNAALLYEIGAEYADNAALLYEIGQRCYAPVLR